MPTTGTGASALVLWVALTLLLAGASLRASSLVYLAIAGAASMSVLVAALPILAKRRLTEPPLILAAMLVWGATLKLAYLAATGGGREMFAERIAPDGDLGKLVPGAIVLSIGTWVCYVGYIIGEGQLRSLTTLLARRSLVKKKLLRLGTLTLFVSATSLALWAVSEGISPDPETWSQKRFNDTEGGPQQRASSIGWIYFRAAGLARAVFILTFAASLIETAKRLELRFLTFASLLVAVATPVFADNRAGVGIVVLDAAIVYLAIRGRPPVLRGAIWVMSALMILTFMIMSRDGRTLVDAVEQTIGGRDLMDVSKTSQIVSAVPSRVPYQAGESLMGWITAPLPGSLDPYGEQWLQVGQLVHREVYGYSGISGIPPGLVGELWLNYGLLGVLVGCVIVGWTLRIIWNTFEPVLQNPLAAALYAVVASRLVLGSFGNNLGTGFWKAALDAAPLLCLILLTSSVRRSHAS